MALIMKNKEILYGLEDLDNVVVNKLETKTEAQIKKLVEKQLSKTANLENEVNLNEKFVTADTYKFTTGSLHGTQSFESIKNIQNEESKIEILKSCGLSDYDIRLKLLEEGSQGISRPLKKLKIDPLIKVERFKEIQKQFDYHEKELNKDCKFRGSVPLTRHEIQIEKSLNLGNNIKMLMPCLFQEVRNKDSFQKPMHLLLQIEKNMNLNLEKLNHNNNKYTFCKKKLDLVKKKSKHLNSVIAKEKSSLINQHSCKPTMWDQELEPSQKDYNNNNNNNNNNIFLLKMKQHKKTLKFISDPCFYKKQNKEITVCDKHNDNHESTKKYSVYIYSGTTDFDKSILPLPQLSVDEVKEIPKFKNHDHGIPSKVIHLKNLARSTSQLDLVKLFIPLEIQYPKKILYRLLKGRMHGQALITFPDIAIAQEALIIAHGRILNGKPIVASYGIEAKMVKNHNEIEL